jgi:hypothetical protein
MNIYFTIIKCKNIKNVNSKMFKKKFKETILSTSYVRNVITRERKEKKLELIGIMYICYYVYMVLYICVIFLSYVNSK